MPFEVYVILLGKTMLYIVSVCLGTYISSCFDTRALSLQGFGFVWLD